MSLTKNGLVQYTSIGDKFGRFDNLLIMSCVLVFFSLTLKMTHFSVIP